MAQYQLLQSTGEPVAHIPVPAGWTPPHIPENLMHIPRSLDMYRAPLIGSSAEDIVQEISANVGRFIENQIEKRSFRTMLILGRKAKLLFEPYLDRMIYKGYSPAYLRKLNRSSWITGTILNKVVLLADCINTGEEVLDTIKIMKTKKHDVERIYCFALNVEAEARFAKMGLNIPVIAANRLTDEESKQFFLKVQVYYQGLIHPLDSDHAYDIYRVSPTFFSVDQIQMVLETAISKVIGLSNVQFIDDPSNSLLYLPKNVTNKILNVPAAIDPKKTALNPMVQALLGMCDFEQRLFQLKIFNDPTSIKFCLMCCFTVSSFERAIKLIEHPSGCRIYNHSKCYKNRVLSDQPPCRMKEKLCPLCIENLVERSILNEVSRNFGPGGSALVSSHDPIDR